MTNALDGLLAIILFGSYARRDYDRGSDIDLLLLFEDGINIGHAMDRIADLTATRELFVQAIPLTVSQLKSSPLVGTVLGEGILLYASENFDMRRLLGEQLKPYALVTYDASRLPQRRKVKFIQKLQGRGKGRYIYKGLLHDLHGFKVGRNVVMIPADSAEALRRYLEEYKVPHIVRRIWTSG